MSQKKLRTPNHSTRKGTVITMDSKKNYLSAEIEITKFTSQDIVTASTADNFDYVDQDAWDS